MLSFYYFLVFTVSISSINSSFINKSAFSRAVDPEERLEYLTDYLEGFSAIMSTFDTRTQHFLSASHYYSRGLKKDFLEFIRTHSNLIKRHSLAQTPPEPVIPEGIITDIIAHFSECYSNTEDGHGFENTSNDYGTRRHKRTNLDKEQKKLKALIGECVEEAELEIADTITTSVGQAAMEDGHQDAIRIGRVMEEARRRLRRIVDVQRGNATRWPWLTDEGWTWKWVLGLFLGILLLLAIIGLIVYFVYGKFSNSADDSWGDKA